jgi:hypothetical protein
MIVTGVRPHQCFGLLAAMLCLLSVEACMVSRHPAGIAASTGPLPQGYTSLDAAEKSSCSYQFMFIPITGKDDTDQLFSQIINEKGADALVGVTVEQERSLFALPVVGSDCTVVKGLAVKKSQ